MNLSIKKPKVITLETKTVIYIQQIGGYQTLNYGNIWERLWGYVKENKLFSAGIEHICIYHGDPKVTAEEKLRTDICLTI